MIEYRMGGEVEKKRVSLANAARPGRLALQRQYARGVGSADCIILGDSAEERMLRVVAAVIEREDRRFLIGQRRRGDSSPLKWEFPGGKVKNGEELEAALARELKEELGVTLMRSREIAQVRHQYANYPEELEIHFFAARILDEEMTPRSFEQVAWVLPKELGQYDFLAANRDLIARIATGKIKAREILGEG
jgi:mutator protein MutT